MYDFINSCKTIFQVIQGGDYSKNNALCSLKPCPFSSWHLAGIASHAVPFCLVGSWG